MAEVMDSYEFRHYGRGRSKYPWDEWLDGRVWKLERGKDYSVSEHSMDSQLRSAARKRVGNMQIKMGIGFLIIQFHKAPEK